MVKGVAAAVCFWAGIAVAQVPVPPDLQIVAPGPEIPADMARFAGVWGDGAWGGVLPTALIVERIAADGTAGVVYAVGAAAQYGIAPQWSRVPGRVEGGRLVLTLRGGIVVDYAMDAQGRLDGRFMPPQNPPSRATLSRVADAAALVRPVRTPWEDLRIPVRTEAGTLQLQGFLYRSTRPGPRPLVVLNHGSTDGERPGVPSIQPFTAQAQLFVDRGWTVLAFMRRGRGLSEGTMSEPSDPAVPSDQQMATALADLDAAVSFMRQQPGIDAARIVVAGQSRGGLLAVAYAGRHADGIAGVVNFSGGWWSEQWDRARFNVQEAARAGASPVPMLWLYADHDRYYGLPFVRGMFAAFQAAGGRGELLTFDGLSGDGHGLVAWTERWAADVGRFLDRIAGQTVR